MDSGGSTALESVEVAIIVGKARSTHTHMCVAHPLGMDGEPMIDSMEWLGFSPLHTLHISNYHPQDVNTYKFYFQLDLANQQVTK